MKNSIWAGLLIGAHIKRTRAREKVGENMSKVTATLKLHIDIAQAREMGIEIENEEDYAIEEMVEWISEMMKRDDIYECIKVEKENK